MGARERGRDKTFLPVAFLVANMLVHVMAESCAFLLIDPFPLPRPG